MYSGSSSNGNGNGNGSALTLAKVPGSLMIDVFLRSNFTTDTNAELVGFFREFADAEAFLGNATGAATLRSLASDGAQDGSMAPGHGMVSCMVWQDRLCRLAIGDNWGLGTLQEVGSSPRKAGKSTPGGGGGAGMSLT